MGKNILFIRYKTVEAIEEGGGRLTNMNLSFIRKIFSTKNVEEYPVNDNSKKSRLLDKIIFACNFFRNYHYGLTPSKVETILKKMHNFDIIYIDRSIFGIIAKLLKKNGFKGKIITFFHNYEYQYFQDRLSSLNPLKVIIKKSVRNNELFAVKYSDIIIALNERDNKLIESKYGRKADFLIPISFKNSYEPSSDIMQKKNDKPITCLFLGSYFAANVHGILWFVKNVFPYVNIRLQIAGKDIHKIQNKLPKSQNIELYSNVQDLCYFFENADIMILPVFKGSGMKVKTCEAMMYGKFIIGTTEAFEGYNVNYNKIGALANTKDEYIKAIEKFSSTNTLKYNEYARTFYLENHSEEVIYKKFEEILCS